ncbi:MAG: aromatic ring-hydroxylating dioxygenase subunit alpha [Rubrivivax sp.]|nr:aromatic ring-hydroxylating dioxygenase subunit alpha [Rubrivivax sp.]
MNPPPPWWVPVAGSQDLRAATPLAARAFGQELVLWRAASSASASATAPTSAATGEPGVIDAPGALGAPSAFLDRCPHRGARLSLGRIDYGRLECAYHGWRFDTAGRCVAIPALPAFTPPETHRACAWQAMEAHGLVWLAEPAAPRTAPHGPDPLAAEDGRPALPPRRVLCGPFDVATSAPRVVENFLDTAHFGFVHEGFLGSREQLAVPDYRVEHDPFGRPVVPLYRAWQPRASTAATVGGSGAWVDYSYRVLGPFAALLTKKAEGAAPAEAYALWCCPIDEETTRVWFTICTDDLTRSDDELRSFQATIFGQDAPVLQSQRPHRLPLQGGELHCAADRLSVAYRRWLLALGVTYGTTCSTPLGTPLGTTSATS